MVIRLSPARRAALHRVFFPLLVTLSAMVIIIGKVDRVALEPLRISAMDAAAPLLQVLSQPTAFLITRLRLREAWSGYTGKMIG